MRYQQIAVLGWDLPGLACKQHHLARYRYGRPVSCSSYQSTVSNGREDVAAAGTKGAMALGLDRTDPFPALVRYRSFPYYPDSISMMMRTCLLARLLSLFTSSDVAPCLFRPGTIPSSRTRLPANHFLTISLSFSPSHLLLICFILFCPCNFTLRRVF